MARTSPCDRRDAQTRLSHARRFLEVAELVAVAEPTESGYESVAASLAVPRPGIDLTSNRALAEALDEGKPLDRLR